MLLSKTHREDSSSSWELVIREHTKAGAEDIVVVVLVLERSLSAVPNVTQPSLIALAFIFISFQDFNSILETGKPNPNLPSPKAIVQFSLRLRPTTVHCESCLSLFFLLFNAGCVLLSLTRAAESDTRAKHVTQQFD